MEKNLSKGFRLMRLIFPLQCLQQSDRRGKKYHADV